jgi:succinate dehydrogenase/fumarate reductase flavoprotein subunit
LKNIGYRFNIVTKTQADTEAAAMSNAEDPDEGSIGFNRRDLLKLGGLGVAALAAPVIMSNLNRRSSVAVPAAPWLRSEVLVIGSGFAGVFAALESRRAGLSVTLVDKGTVGWSGLSPWASDSRPFDPTIYDRKEWLDNLAVNTEWLFDRRWMEIFLDESLDIFHTLRKWGCHECHPFERSKIFRALLEDSGVQLVERVMVNRLVKDGAGRVCGAVGFTFDDSQAPCREVKFACQAVLLCAGAGGYKSPGFPNWGQTFDGDAMAYEAGAGITGKEFHDTHQALSVNPAASYDGWRWAQSVKGAYIMVGPPGRLHGGLTLDAAVLAASARFSRLPGSGPGGEPPSGTGMRHGPDPEQLRNRGYAGRGFLAIPGLTLDFGEPPPASNPSEGYRVGGATAGMGVHKGEGVFCSDYTGQADGVPGLFAAGDSLGSMLCGPLYPGRGFASYGSAIQGRRAARFAAAWLRTQSPTAPLDSDADESLRRLWAPRGREHGFSVQWATQLLRSTMTPLHILYIKNARRLDGALASIEYVRDNIVPNLVASDGHQLRGAHELAHMVLNAEMKLRAGLYRTESRGTHYREEFPARNDDEWFCYVVIAKAADGSMQLRKHPLPREWRPPPGTPYRDAYPRVWPGEDRFREQAHGEAVVSVTEKQLRS